jgi:membrane protein
MLWLCKRTQLKDAAMKLIRTAWQLLRQTFEEWNADNAPRLAAALAFYIAFSLAPLLVITIGIVGFVLQEAFVREEVLTLVTRTMGESAGVFVDELIDGIRQPQAGIITTLLGIGALLLGALGAFEQLKSALNTVWNVPQSMQAEGIRGFITNKLLSFGMVLMIGFLLLVSLILSTILSALESYTLSIWAGAEVALYWLNIVLSYAIVTLLFAMIYRFLPDIRLQWRDVLIGAFITTLLFNLGKYALSLYLSNSGLASAYGAAGSFVLILFWIYYSAQIVLFGAEFTQVYARRYGSLRDLPTPSKGLPNAPQAAATPNVLLERAKSDGSA